MPSQLGPSYSDLNTKCNNVAVAAGLKKGWRGLVSGSQSAKGNVNARAPVYDMVGNLIALSTDDFWDGTITNPIKYNEKGEDVGSIEVWTGTLSTGLLDTSNSCNKWSTNPEAYFGAYGLTSATGAEWIAAGTAPCTSAKAIYCVQN